MLNKIRIISAAAAALLMLGGCGVTEVVDDIRGAAFEKTQFEDDADYTQISAVSFVSSDSYAANDNITFGYDSLTTDAQRSCYDMIAQSAFKISEQPDSAGLYPIGKVKVNDAGFTAGDMDVCIKAFTMDHPEIFWLSNRYTYGNVGSQYVIQLFSYVSGSECIERISVLTDEVNKIVSGIPGGLKQYHLEKYVHNTLLDGCTYATGVKYAENGWEEFTVYGAIVNGSAVCEGYAHAMCLLLNHVGIECYYVNGYGENAPHMWNTVKIDDNWYHLDATWDDNENAYFNYFNLDDERILADHVISEKYETLRTGDTLPDIYNIFLPECTSENANYFVVESTYISDFEESHDIMVNDLIEAAQKGDDMFTIRLNEDIAYSDALDLMFHEEPYYMFSYIEDANEQLDDVHQINNENLAIIMIENFNVIVVKLEY